MATLLSPTAAVEVIRELVKNRKHHIWQDTSEVSDKTIDAMTDILAKAFLVDIFTPAREPGKPQYKASLIRVNARFNVRASGEVTRAYLVRQMDRFIGSQQNARA